jgi:tetratricopeptide (TPR) repeat protein
MLSAANAEHAAGRLVEAERLASQVLARMPENTQARLLLGVLTGKTNRDAEALEHLKHVIQANPASFEALFWTSILFRRAKQFEEALTYAKKTVEVRPEDAHGQNNLGLCYLDLLRLDEAVECFRSASAIRPDMAPIQHNLGTALYMLGRDIDSAKAFDRAITLNPRAVDSFLSLGQVMLSQTNPSAAAECARRALSMSAATAAGHLLLASALVEDSRPAEAEPHLKRAIQLDPQDAQAQALLGMRFQSLGRFEEANEQLKKSMASQPRQGFAYFAYAHNNKITEKDLPRLETMETLVAEGGLPPRELDFLHYGLGRSLESLGKYERAIQHFDEANRIAYRIKFGDAEFDRAQYARNFDRIIETFSQDSLDHHQTRGDPSDLPIVIVGMMRSGTTLTEQILSSHPMVGPAGEDRFWPQNWQRVLGKTPNSMAPSSLAAVASDYLKRLDKVAPGFSRVTDKMPANYEFLGPIHLSLPNARIIHMCRNPLDTCISIYTTPNRVPVEFAYNRDNIAFAYEQYQRLAAHWRAVLPANRLLEIVYEELVADPEAVTRNILEFCGLEWDDACLHHERNDRNVITPSLWQVRQPMYSSSIGRWKRYEPWLGAFQRLLPANAEP